MPTLPPVGEKMAALTPTMRIGSGFRQVIQIRLRAFLGFAGHSPGWSPGLLFSKGVNSGRGACDQSLASIFSRVFQLRAVTTALKRSSRYAYERVIALTPSGVQTYASVPSIEMTSGL